MKSILVLTCLCFLGTSNVYGTSKRVLDFLSYFSGDFDNKAQTQQDGDDHDFVQMRFTPVDIKCLQPTAVVFVEEFVNNDVRIVGLTAVTDGIEDTVTLVFHNFTDYTKYTPSEFNVEILANISCGEISEIKDCNASYRVSTEGFAYGNFPDCRYTVNGEHPRFTCLHFCDTVTSTLSMYSDQTSPMEPYEYIRTGNKYPLINKPPGYVSPCGN